MFNNIVYACDECSHEVSYPVNWGDHNGERCPECREGTLRKSGEEYDQEFIEEERYNREQDREYEERHRNDDRY